MFSNQKFVGCKLYHLKNSQQVKEEKYIQNYDTKTRRKLKRWEKLRHLKCQYGSRLVVAGEV